MSAKPSVYAVYGMVSAPSQDLSALHAALQAQPAVPTSPDPEFVHGGLFIVGDSEHIIVGAAYEELEPNEYRPVSGLAVSALWSSALLGLTKRSALLPYYGNSSTQPVTAPMPTLTTRDRHGLIGYAASLEECRYRMILPREAARAMEFPEDYVFLGDRDQTIEMIGNAVTPNAGRDLVGMVVEALTGQDIALPAHSGPSPAVPVCGEAA
ncbi:DNA cytosine methyltransferase [Streptomyces bobili]